MRVVGGQWRGRPLKAPAGSGTRPSTDRMREAVASMVASARGLDLDGAWVLDAFCGSGALGLELVSRGAEGCVLAGRLGDRPFDVVLLDPPYRMDPGLSASLLGALRERGLLAPGCLVVHERAADAAPLEVDGLAALRERPHGGSVVTLLEDRTGEEGTDAR